MSAGVAKWADSMVMIGVASRLEGPWDIRHLVRAEEIKLPNAYQYRVYAHVWAAEPRTNKSLVLWCDHWPGGVILARVKFESRPRMPWVTIAMNSCSGRTALMTAIKAHEICRWDRTSRAAWKRLIPKSYNRPHQVSFNTAQHLIQCLHRSPPLLGPCIP